MFRTVPLSIIMNFSLYIVLNVKCYKLFIKCVQLQTKQSSLTYGTGRMPWDICDHHHQFIQPYVDVEDQMKPQISIASIQMDCSHNSISCYTNYSTEYCPVSQPTYKGILKSSWIELIPKHTLTFNSGHRHPLKSLCKRKAIPLQAWRGLDGSRMLRLPDFKTTGT